MFWKALPKGKSSINDEQYLICLLFNEQYTQCEKGKLI